MSYFGDVIRVRLAPISAGVGSGPKRGTVGTLTNVNVYTGSMPTLLF